ncbi:non-reducing end alpha-L-arabinofuranosidase family hydrolase [Motilibacter deserti]|uniref:non-reducing end alpha-L-arabinofuranosidase family hydrolase n=1 Tax=Motilibacter deserti TaxID=2714956 RepID=UPI001E4CA242|nr:non-reducing end alpha-L-arabinofuranosidase family hydrolase [Motilibacter deserti]
MRKLATRLWRRSAVALAAVAMAVTPAMSAPAQADTPPDSFRWASTGVLISPKPDATHVSVASKDPTVVFADGKYHVFFTTADGNGWNIAYTSFTDWADADEAPHYYLDQSAIGRGYRAAPQVFYFEPQGLWYLIFQNGNAGYSTTRDISDPTSWSRVRNFYAQGMPDVIRQNIGNGFWLDFWNICDEEFCYLFSSDDNGQLYRSQTRIEDFPNGYGNANTVIALQEPNRNDLFEASATYKIKGTDKYLLLVEAIDPRGRRWYRSWTGDSVRGPWTQLAATLNNPFSSVDTVSFPGGVWTRDVSHGELLRVGYGQTPTIDPCAPVQFLYQGLAPEAGGPYNALPYRLALATAVGENPITALCAEPDAAALSDAVAGLAGDGHVQGSVARDLQGLLDSIAEADGAGDVATERRLGRDLVERISRAATGKLDADAWAQLWAVLDDSGVGQDEVSAVQRRVAELSRNGSIAASTARGLQDTLSVAANAPTPLARSNALDELRSAISSARTDKVSPDAKDELLELLDVAVANI